MSENKWTPEQQGAIEVRNSNLLVAAAAGAGKTAVLVERIIRMIRSEEECIDIDKLLIVTFTNAAATEMRERIADAISKVLEENPSSQKMHRQLTLLNKASITTIHSFCLEVIRGNFQSLDIDPGFRIADETETVLLKLEVLQELFEELYEDTESNQTFLDLLECYGGNRDDQALQNIVLNLHDFIQSTPWPEAWLKKMTAAFNPSDWEDLGKTQWGEELIKAAELELRGLQKLMLEAIKIIEDEPGLKGYYPVFQDEASWIGSLLNLSLSERPNRWDVFYTAMQSFTFDKLPRAGKDCNPEQRDTVKDIRDTVKKRIGDLREKVFTVNSEETWQDLQILYPLMNCLAGLVQEFMGRYSVKKRENAIVDFNDLEHLCLGVLTEQDENDPEMEKPSKVASGYRERFAEILVDEYQDSNDVQETIIRRISEGDTEQPRVFMVGDVKQSIYRFRQANPELFQGKYEEYSELATEPNRKILLYKNFRSRKEVLDAVNFIFQQIMSKEVGELDYTEKEALNPGADYPINHEPGSLVGGEVELHLLQTEVKDSWNTMQADMDSDIDSDFSSLEGQQDGQEEDSISQEDPEMLDSMQCEARLVAARIKELLRQDQDGKEFQILDKETQEYRKVEYRDIVILLRTTRNWAEVFAEEFAMQGIPTFADTGSGFFKTVEVQVILSLLQVIDNPLQDIPLLAVLRSPIVSFTTDELAELRLADRKSLLYHALQALVKEGASHGARKGEKFLKDLERWRELSLYLSTDQLLWQLYQETGYFGMAGAMPGGQQRQANLRILFERARQFEETSFKGLFHFIYFIDKLKTSKGDMGSAKMLGEKDNVVRIMSIHKSKGLEFPVVFLSGCGKKFNLQDMNKSILLHHKLGFGPDVVDYRKRISYSSIPKLAIRERIRRETMSEEMRILYVAMTRAKEKLIITGTVKNIEKAHRKWLKAADVQNEKLPSYQTIKAENYLDWIGPALERDCSSVFSVRNWQKAELLSKNLRKEQDEKEFLSWLDNLNQHKNATNPENGAEAEVIGPEVARRLSWAYPFGKLTGIPAKVTVTELKRRRYEDTEEGLGFLPETVPALVKKPLFLSGKKGLSGAEAGTVLHFIMQKLDFTDPDLENQLKQMIDRDLLTRQQAESVNLEKIRSFLTSPLGKRMIASGNCNREMRFNMEIPCKEVYPNMEEESCQAEILLLQGVIDCYFEEEDGLVLLDYKTDYVPEGGEEAVKEKYWLQISYYARALEKLTGKKVKERYIYLFYLGKALEISIN